jgi:3alpha(or 20beta)-hydroxysteroid dehydrogenase
VSARFEGKVAIITGAARGMGASHARGFHGEGARVVLTDLLEEQGVELADELGDGALFARHDVRDEQGWSDVVAAAESAFGPVSILVNNAAITHGKVLLERYELAAWRDMLEVNLVGQFLGIKTCTPSMRRAGGGAIVNVGSVGGNMAVPGSSAYCASKWGVRGLTRGAALELGRYGIRVNSVHPGFVETELMRSANYPPSLAASFAIPRVGAPEELTRLVLYLASDEASFSTGGDFVADGGLLLGSALQPDGGPEWSAVPAVDHR